MTARSELSAALDRVLHNLPFTRQGWASILNVSQEDIDHWLADSEIVFPKPETLRRLFRVVTEIDKPLGLEREAIEGFVALKKKPMRQIARHAPLGPEWWRDEYTLEHYMLSVPRKAFLELLDTLDPATQEKVLAAASEIARAWRVERSA